MKKSVWDLFQLSRRIFSPKKILVGNNTELNPFSQRKIQSSQVIMNSRNGVDAVSIPRVVDIPSPRDKRKSHS